MLDPIGSILLTEGGYVDDPADHGGPTKFGITQKTLAAYLGRPTSVDEVRSLSPVTARKIYESQYLHGPHIDRLPDPLQVQVLDIAINMGQVTAVRMLQGVLGITQDGIIGVGTLGCIHCGQPNAINDALVDARVHRYQQIAHDDPTQDRFLAGWIKRAAAFRI